jgi:large subunit ribosomal protein L18
VFRSSKHLYAQAIDDDRGHTLAHASTRDAQVRSEEPRGGTVAAAKVVGGAMAAKLQAAGIDCVVFDRGGFVYHGRIRAVADALREAGIKL